MAAALCVCTLEGDLLEVTEMRDSISLSSIYLLSSQCLSHKHRKEHAEALDTDAIKKQSYLQSMTCTKAHSLVKDMTFISTQDTQRCLWNCTLYEFLHNTVDTIFTVGVMSLFWPFWQFYGQGQGTIWQKIMERSNENENGKMLRAGFKLKLPTWAPRLNV